MAQPPELLGRRSGEHWAGRLYLRRLSPHLTRAAVGWGLSADAVTGLMIACGLVGAGLVALPGVAPAVGGAVLMQAHLLFDCVDGEVARWRRTTGPRGVYLDRVGHYLVEGALLVALGARAGELSSAAWLAVGMAGAIGVLVAKAETDLVDVARARHGLPPVTEEAAVLRGGALAGGRRLASFLPVHRIVHAIEASLLVAAAAVVDGVAGGLAFTRGLAVAMAVVALGVAGLHLVSVLASRRLVAGP